ncbi:MAG: hypothetical protein K0S53_1484 [Bacteroidetes bacterium]|jgi:hypothetical protein|nr:hypothetical protein [Bacteroidota bacterium]MDF2451752.1 hypothetical protein [Bacteroidota bacterium]
MCAKTVYKISLGKLLNPTNGEKPYVLISIELARENHYISIKCESR